MYVLYIFIYFQNGLRRTLPGQFKQNKYAVIMYWGL